MICTSTCHCLHWRNCFICTVYVGLFGWKLLAIFHAFKFRWKSTQWSMRDGRRDGEQMEMRRTSQQWLCMNPVLMHPNWVSTRSANEFLSRCDLQRWYFQSIWKCARMLRAFSDIFHNYFEIGHLHFSGNQKRLCGFKRPIRVHSINLNYCWCWLLV